ncbi:hypothetical protein M9458_006132, partial [Cirrhinus mrigala]
MKSALQARSLCVVPETTVITVICAHAKVNCGWLNRVFLNRGWLYCSAQPAAPKSIFAMSQCTSDSEFLTVGCMTRGFSPADSLTFKWLDPADKELSDFVQYPAFGPEGDYTKISHMR